MIFTGHAELINTNWQISCLPDHTPTMIDKLLKSREMLQIIRQKTQNWTEHHSAQMEERNFSLGDKDVMLLQLSIDQIRSELSPCMHSGLGNEIRFWRSVISNDSNKMRFPSPGHKKKFKDFPQLVIECYE